MSGGVGRLITIEGVDGAGKSTHVDWLAGMIRARGPEVVVTREPGGTALGEALRLLLLSQTMEPATETLLMFAARQEHLAAVILPALERGAWVVCDRFTDATFAYQGAGKGVAVDRLRLLESWVQGTLQPDLTLLFDLDPAVARERLAAGRELDKFERESAAFFEQVRQGYLLRAQEAPGRIHILDASKTVELVRQELEKIILNTCFI